MKKMPVGGCKSFIQPFRSNNWLEIKQVIVFMFIIKLICIWAQYWLSADCQIFLITLYFNKYDFFFIN